MKKIEPVKNIYELTAADVATLKQMIKEDKQGRRGSSSNKSFIKSPNYNYATHGNLIPKEHCDRLDWHGCKWSDADQWCHNCFYGGGMVCRGRNAQPPCTGLNVNHSIGPNGLG